MQKFQDRSTNLTPEHHGITFPEARGGFLPPVGHQPFEGCVFQKHQQDTHKDPHQKQKVQPCVLLKDHLRSLALQLVVIVIVITLGSPEEKIL